MSVGWEVLNQSPRSLPAILHEQLHVFESIHLTAIQEYTCLLLERNTQSIESGSS